MLKGIIMKGFITFILAVISFHALYSQREDNNSNIVRVLSFNILHGATTSGDFDLDVIAKVINDAEPDFVALQEVDFKTGRAKQYDLATELGWRVKMAPIFGRAMYYDGGEYGEAILSRYTFIKSRNISLPHSPGSEPRAALEVVTIMPSGDTLAFVGTHLDHLSDETDRIAQVKKLNDVFSSNNYPTVLAGDLNAEPGSTPINILESLWTSSYDKGNPEKTFPSDSPRKKIDYVMTFPEKRWKVLETRVICDTIASDHCAWLVILELLN
jgi:endonuclease/exonuclease/phosphatase family metal-dependent hydrolase